MEQELRELLETGIGFTSYVQETANNMLEELRVGKGILPILTPFIDDMQTLIEAVEMAQSKGIGIQAEKISTQVADMLEAITNQDYNLLADILEYDLNDQLDEWREIFANVLETEA